MSKATIQSLLTPADIQLNGSRPWDMQVHNDKLYALLLKDPSLGLGESYMDGWWSCTALEQMMAKVMAAKLDYKVSDNLKTSLHIIASRLFNMQSVRRAKEVADVHYNLDNALYRDMLGPSMSYTCGYFKDTDKLDIAQEQKHDLICKKLSLKPGDRVLEMGCGWGGFAEFAAKNYGVRMDSLNISEEQINYAKQRCQNLNTTFHLCDWRNIEAYNPTGIQFDHVVSIGMAEHVGYKNYSPWFKIVRQQLKDNGLFLLHTIGSNISLASSDPWIQKYIFPNGMLPSIRQFGRAMEHIFVMEDWHSFGAYYDNTLMSWYNNFNDNWDKHKEKYGERFYKMWTYYLLSCAGGFRSRAMQLWQIVLSKEGRPSGYESVR